MKVWVLYYTRKVNVDDNIYNLNHYKFFLTKRDLAIYLNKQDDNFFAIGIRKLDASNSSILDKNYLEIKTKVKNKGK